MPIVIFLIGIVAGAASPLSSPHTRQLESSHIQSIQVFALCVGKY